MWQLIFGALIGGLISAVVSFVVAEIYHRRQAREFEKRLKEFDSLYENLEYLIVSAGEKADAAGDKAHESWLATVDGTPSHPDWPYK